MTTNFKVICTSGVFIHNISYAVAYGIDDDNNYRVVRLDANPIADVKSLNNFIKSFNTFCTKFFVGTTIDIDGFDTSVRLMDIYYADDNKFNVYFIAVESESNKDEQIIVFTKIYNESLIPVEMLFEDIEYKNFVKVFEYKVKKYMENMYGVKIDIDLYQLAYLEPLINKNPKSFEVMNKSEILN